MLLQPASFALKFGFLAVLYLFLLWVAWGVLRDVRRGSRRVEEVDGEAYSPPPSDATSMYAASVALENGVDAGEPRLRVEHAPGHESGVAYDLLGPVTLGRRDVEI